MNDKGIIKQALDAQPYLFATPSDLASIEDGGWQEPIPLDDFVVPDIPCSLLPGWLGEFAEGISMETQTPPALSVMLALAVVATCVQRLAVVSPYGDNYQEPLNIWTVTVLPPASRKTAVFKPFTQPLTLWESEQVKEATLKIIEFEAKEAINKKSLDALERDAAKAKDDIEKSILLSEVTKLREDLSAACPIIPRLWTGDVTAEQLQNMMLEQSERMSVLSDEGGIFEVMTGLYTDGRANMDVFLQAHAGKSVRVDRGSRTVTLREPALSFGLAVQPAVVSVLGNGNKKRLRGNGTLARFLYCYPKSNIGMRNLRRRVSLAEETKLRYETNITYLLNLRAKLNSLIVLTPSMPAFEMWIDFSEQIEKRQGVNGDLEAIQDWTGKLPGACLRIAGLLHACETDLDSTEITEDIMTRAVSICSLLIEHARAVFNICGADPNIEDARYLSDWLSKNAESGFAKQRDLVRLPRFRNGKRRKLDEALAILQERNIIGKKVRTGKTKPSYVYPVNPQFGELARFGTRHFSPEHIDQQ